MNCGGNTPKDITPNLPLGTLLIGYFSCMRKIKTFIKIDDITK